MKVDAHFLAGKLSRTTYYLHQTIKMDASARIDLILMTIATLQAEVVALKKELVPPASTTTDTETVTDSPMFTFRNSLGRKYDNTKCVLKITFPISRYRQHKQTLSFPKPVTEHAAIRSAERFLSFSCTKKYYTAVQDDLFDCILSWEDSGVTRKFECLGNAVYIDTSTVDDDGHLTIGLGS